MSNFCLFDSTKPLPITFLCLALHYLFLGLADLFTLAGVLSIRWQELLGIHLGYWVELESLSSLEVLFVDACTYWSCKRGMQTLEDGYW